MLALFVVHQLLGKNICSLAANCSAMSTSYILTVLLLCGVGQVMFFWFLKLFIAKISCAVAAAFRKIVRLSQRGIK